MKLFLSLTALISVSFFGAEAGPACSINQATLMQDVQYCMQGSPNLAKAFAQHLNDPSYFQSADFLCSFKSDIAQLFVCLEDKVADCLPLQKEGLLALLPTQASLMDGFNFMCEHKSDVNNKCFDSAFTQCSTMNMQQLFTAALSNVKDPQQIMCNVIRAVEKCFANKKATCGEEVVSVAIQTLEKIFPVKHCPSNTEI